ncbi:MAG: hypothetical protein EBX50_07310 [Chitinophagia bacterium]|nr:hypothetical protein [Chitinophagia bacterium]
MKRIHLIIPYKKEIDAKEIPVLLNPKYELEVFDARVIDFANRLSLRILRDVILGKIAPFVALAFWLRRSNMEKMVTENKYLKTNSVAKAVPIGTVFHVCPSNVDTMFVYSLMISLLVGNRNILRLSSKTDDNQISYLLHLINEEISTSSPMLSDYINVVMYERDNDVNIFFSQRSQARVLWGGDEMVRTFIKIDDNVRCRDLVFSDRISLCLISAESFLALDDVEQKKLSHLFYNDTYTFDQKGCSSPQQVIFLGSEENAAVCADMLFTLVDEIAANEYAQDDYSLASMKYNQLVSNVMQGNVSEFQIYSSRLYSVRQKIKGDAIHHCGGGYFHLSVIKSVIELVDLVNIKYQTLTYFGLKSDELILIEKLTIGRGIDRIVPMGQALDFNYVWDGYNLIEQLICYKAIKFSN